MPESKEKKYQKKVESQIYFFEDECDDKLRETMSKIRIESFKLVNTKVIKLGETFYIYDYENKNFEQENGKVLNKREYLLLNQRKKVNIIIKIVTGLPG